MLCDVSRQSFASLYSRLRISPKLKELGESFYNPMLPAVVQELLDKGVATTLTSSSSAAATATTNASSAKPKPKPASASAASASVTHQSEEEAEEEAEADNSKQKTEGAGAGAVLLWVKPEGASTATATATASATATATGGSEFPLIVRKSDGGYTYDSTDLCAVRYRVRECGAQWIVYVTDAGQQ